jgi:hypothetical protein
MKRLLILMGVLITSFAASGADMSNGADNFYKSDKVTGQKRSRSGVIARAGQLNVEEALIRERAPRKFAFYENDSFPIHKSPPNRSVAATSVRATGCGLRKSPASMATSPSSWRMRHWARRC